VLALAAHVALGRPLGEREIERGRVLMFAGENADDVCARWIALGHYMDFDVEKIDVHFVPGRFKIADLIEKIRTEMEALGGCALLIIDTSAAYFPGEDENDNVQLGQHASNMRELRIPGGPCTLINCHPPKNAADDSLLPRGGGAFLAEVDGNLTAVKNAMTVKVHWQGKFRGPEFDPINFILKGVTTDRLKDSKGRPIWTVFAKFLSDEAEEQMADSARRDEDALLANLIDHGHASIAVLAKRMGWLTKNGEPQKSKVHGVLERLKAAKIVRSDRGRERFSPARGKSRPVSSKLTEGTEGMVVEAKKIDLEARPLNGRMWQPGESGNRHGRPVGARGRFSERFVTDLTRAWEQYGENALAETAKLYPDRFVAIASHLIPKDVSVSLTARLPANLDATDWEVLIELLTAIKQCLPDAGQRQPGEVMRYVLEALQMANAPTIEG
jgi:AAA domain